MVLDRKARKARKVIGTESRPRRARMLVGNEGCSRAVSADSKYHLHAVVASTICTHDTSTHHTAVPCAS